MKQLLAFCICISTFTESHSQTVQPFLESIVSQFPNVRDIAITGDEKEVFFSAQSVIGDKSALVTVSRDQDDWVTQEVLPFSGQYFDIEPFISSDGLTLYFASNRPMDNSSEDTKDFDIWFVTRKNKQSKWSTPKNLGAPINTEMDEFYPVITDSKNIYFTLDNKSLKQKDDIYVSEFIDGKYTTPIPLSKSINSSGYEFNAYVAPDESFLIYTCYNREGGFGSGDLYISYKTEDHTWTPSENMGKSVNSDKMDYCPFVNLKTNSLYFTSKRITSSNTKDSKLTIEDLKKMFNNYANGASRLFKTSFKNTYN